MGNGLESLFDEHMRGGLNATDSQSRLVAIALAKDGDGYAILRAEGGKAKKIGVIFNEDDANDFVELIDAMAHGNARETKSSELEAALGRLADGI